MTYVRRAITEVALILGLWLGYSASRLLASNDLEPALHRAHRLLHFEKVYGIDLEHWVNHLFVDTGWLGLFGAYYYASAHYLVTGAVLIWLYVRGPGAYRPARRALVIATLIGLAVYLLMPTAPPRFTEGYVDVMNLHAGQGWWAGDASAPAGLGGLTNELAAFPSLHAGWALWVALAVGSQPIPRPWKIVAWAHAVVTAVVVVGTGNHWILDVVAGWAIVATGWVAARAVGGMVGPAASTTGSPVRAVRSPYQSENQ